MLYVDVKWVTNFQALNSYCDQSLEMLTVKINLHWKLGEINEIVIIICYAPSNGESSKLSIAKSTIGTIVKSISEVERQLPGYAVIIMGDFNRLSILLTQYHQVVTKAVQSTKILDKSNEYFNFRTDLCIPQVTVKQYSINKPCITKDIMILIHAKHESFKAGDLQTYKKLRHKIRCDITKSKKQ